MKNVLLVGKNNSITQSIYRRLSTDYMVQLGSDSADRIRELLEMVRPDLILICIIDFNKEHTELMQIIKDYAIATPVTCVGRADDVFEFRDYTDGKTYEIIYRPTTTIDILNNIRKRLSGVHDVQEKQEKKKILIVDDSAIQLRALKGILENRFHVEIAKSGDSAMKTLRRMVPDLIFLDYDMPGCDGKETLERIHAFEPTKETPVVFLTGVNDRQRIHAVLSLEPAGYLLKPVDQEKIMEIIHTILDLELV